MRWDADMMNMRLNDVMQNYNTIQMIYSSTNNLTTNQPIN